MAEIEICDVCAHSKDLHDSYDGCGFDKCYCHTFMEVLKIPDSLMNIINDAKHFDNKANHYRDLANNEIDKIIDITGCDCAMWGTYPCVTSTHKKETK